MQNFSDFSAFLNESKQRTLQDMKAAEWLFQEFNGRISTRLYKIKAEFKDGGRESFAGPLNFGETFGLDLERGTSYEEFEEKMKTVAPHVKVTSDSYDVS